MTTKAVQQCMNSSASHLYKGNYDDEYYIRSFVFRAYYFRIKHTSIYYKIDGQS